MKKTYCFAASLLLILSCFSLHAQPGKWTSLFDGKTLKGWKQMGGTAKYVVEKNSITGITTTSQDNSFLVTEKEYGDFILELEVMIPDTTTNSGIQFRSHWDGSGNDGRGLIYGYQYELDPSIRAWTAGIYDEGRRGWIYPLDLNEGAKKGYRHGQFNKVRIESIGNTIKTWINNIPASYLVDNADAKGLIALQVHAIDRPEDTVKKIYWKNIRIQTTDLTPVAFTKPVFAVNNTPNTLTDSEKNSGWKLLFNGTGSDGWRSASANTFPAKGWKIDDGTISVLSSKEEDARGGDIVTSRQYSAFDFSFEFRLSTGGNSGVKYFVTLPENGKGSALGLEFQVLDDKNHPDAKMGIAGNRTLSSLYDIIPAGKQNRILHPPGEWNAGRIIVYPNNHVEHYLNGVKVLEYERGSALFREAVAKSKFSKIPGFGEGKEGYLLLQDHGDAVSFRSLKIKELK